MRATMTHLTVDDVGSTAFTSLEALVVFGSAQSLAARFMCKLKSLYVWGD
jgi:hypothetical protein